MAVVHIELRWPRALGTFARSAATELQTASRQAACWLLFGLGLVNLLAGLIFRTDWLPTFMALDIVYANFAWAVWVVAVLLGGQPPQARFGIGLAAKVFASSVAIGAMLTAGGLVVVLAQLWRGTAPLDLPLYVAGLYANLGLGALHLALLAVAMQSIVGRKWLAMGTTAIVWIGTNLGFEHPVLRFGSPISPASGISGFGPFVASGIAAGIYWTELSVVLIAAAWWLAGRRSAKAGGRVPRPLGPNAFAVVWTSAVIWVVGGGWIIHHSSLGTDSHVEGSDRAPWASRRDPPQPVYSRLDLDIVISPLERVLVSRGTAIVVNSLDMPMPELDFGIPHHLEVVGLTVTGELVGLDTTRGCHRYRLNRPLEPRETLKIEFDFAWDNRERARKRPDAIGPWEVGVAGPEANPAHSEAKARRYRRGRAGYGALRWDSEVFGDDRGTTRLLENGTFVGTSDILPTLGCTDALRGFRDAPPVLFRARLGTSLDQVAVTAGTLVRAWKENGWSFYEYESREPISPATTIHSGHYAIHREAHDAALVEVFYHPDHRNNVDRMIDAGLATVAHQPATGSGRPLLKVIEVPDYRRFRSVRLLGFGGFPPPTGKAVGLVVPFSERGYPLNIPPLNTPPPTGSTPPRA